MNQLETDSTYLTYPANANLNFERTRRLIVLIPPGIDYGILMRWIEELARASSMNVLLLGLCKDPTEESALRRELTMVASLMEDGRINAEVKVGTGTNWVEVVKAIYKAGDRIVCFAGQQLGPWRRPLSRILESDLNTTVYILAGPQLHTSPLSKYLQICAWMGAIGIVVSFGVLQAKLVQWPANGLQSFLLILSTIPEFLLIWLWNRLFE